MSSWTGSPAARRVNCGHLCGHLRIRLRIHRILILDLRDQQLKKIILVQILAGVLISVRLAGRIAGGWRKETLVLINKFVGR